VVLFVDEFREVNFTGEDGITLLWIGQPRDIRAEFKAIS
jgi:hypothetical protein